MKRTPFPATSFVELTRSRESCETFLRSRRIRGWPTIQSIPQPQGGVLHFLVHK